MVKETKKKSKINPVAAGIAGTAMVAAGVAAVALSKKENRKKAGNALKDLRTKGGKLTKQAARGIEKVMKDEELLRNTAHTAVSTVKKVRDSIGDAKVPKAKVVKKVVTKKVKTKSAASTKKSTKGKGK
jgi:hypothetical protein